MLRKEEILERTNNGLNVFKHSPVNGVSGVISLILYMKTKRLHVIYISTGKTEYTT
jgi:hypothetical protein